MGQIRRFAALLAVAILFAVSGCAYLSPKAAPPPWLREYKFRKAPDGESLRYDLSGRATLSLKLTASGELAYEWQPQPGGRPTRFALTRRTDRP